MAEMTEISEANGIEEAGIDPDTVKLEGTVTERQTAPHLPIDDIVNEGTAGAATRSKSIAHEIEEDPTPRSESSAAKDSIGDGKAKTNKKVQPVSERDTAHGSANWQQSAKPGSQRLLRTPSNVKDASQQRVAPGPADLKLLVAANVPHDKFAPFAEIQWISNLSEGAMGEVHRVKWRGIDCAAKRLKGKHMKDPNSPLYRDMLKEMYVMSKLGFHPNIVQFYGVCSGPQGDPVILLELVVGPSLEDFLQGMKSMLPQWRKQRATLMSWSKGFLKGLTFLHERDPIILHRDLKPGNILLADGLRCIKIADFGVSRLLSKSDRLQRSLTGMTGTRRYMAPEVYACKQGPYSEKADIYSAALVMWEIATGTKPFDGVPSAELQQASVRRKLRPPLELLDWAEFGLLLTKAWNVNPERRPSALELIEELEALPGAPDPRSEVSPIVGSQSGPGGGGSRGELGEAKAGCSCAIL